MLNQVSAEQRLNYVSYMPHDDLKHLMLLECASVVYFFMLPDLVPNITNYSTLLHLETNNGVRINTKRGLHDDLEGWCDPDGLANGLSYGMLTNVGIVV